jgi:hypothetical protein
MDPINLWLDPNEVRQLAEQLIRPVAKTQISATDLGFDSSFVGFVGNDPLLEAPKTAAANLPIITLPLTNTQSEASPSAEPPVLVTTPSIPTAIPSISALVPTVEVVTPQLTAVPPVVASPPAPVTPSAETTPPVTANPPTEIATPNSTIPATAAPVPVIIAPAVPATPASKPVATNPPAFKFTKVIKTPPQVGPIPSIPSVSQTPVIPASIPVLATPATGQTAPPKADPLPTLTPISKLVTSQPPALPGLPPNPQNPVHRPQPFRLVTPKAAEPVVVVTQHTSPSAQPPERIQTFRDWLKTQHQLNEVFIIDQRGEIIFDDSSFKRLHFMARNLAQKTGRLENLRLRISPKEVLELIPCKTEQGTMVLSTVVSTPISQDDVQKISEMMKQTVSPA